MVLPFPGDTSEHKSSIELSLLVINIVAGVTKQQICEILPENASAAPDIIAVGVQDADDDEKKQYLSFLNKELNKRHKYQYLLQKIQAISKTGSFLIIFIKERLINNVVDFVTDCARLDGFQMENDENELSTDDCYATAVRFQLFRSTLCFLSVHLPHRRLNIFSTMEDLNSDEITAFSLLQQAEEALRVQQLYSLMEQIDFTLDGKKLSLLSQEEIVIIGTPSPCARSNFSASSLSYVHISLSNETDIFEEKKRIHLEEFRPSLNIGLACGSSKGTIQAEIVDYVNLYKEIGRGKNYEDRREKEVNEAVASPTAAANAFKVTPVNINIPSIRPYEPICFSVTLQNLHAILPLTYELLCFSSTSDELLPLAEISEFGDCTDGSAIYVSDQLGEERNRIIERAELGSSGTPEFGYHFFLLETPSEAMKSVLTQEEHKQTTLQSYLVDESKGHERVKQHERGSGLRQLFNVFSIFSKHPKNNKTGSTPMYSLRDLDAFYGIESFSSELTDEESALKEIETQFEKGDESPECGTSVDRFSTATDKKPRDAKIELEKWIYASRLQAILLPGQDQTILFVLNIQQSVLDIHNGVEAVLTVRIKELNVSRQINIRANVHPSLLCSSFARLTELQCLPIIEEDSTVDEDPDSVDLGYGGSVEIAQLDLADLREAFGSYKRMEPINSSTKNGEEHMLDSERDDYIFHAQEWINLIFKDPSLVKKLAPKELWWILNHAFLVLVNRHVCMARFKRNQDTEENIDYGFDLVKFLISTNGVHGGYYLKSRKSHLECVNVAKNGAWHESKEFLQPYRDSESREKLLCCVEKADDIPSSIRISPILAALELWGCSVTEGLFPNETLRDACTFSRGACCFIFLLSLDHKLKVCLLYILSLMKEIMLQDYALFAEVERRSKCFTKQLMVGFTTYVRNALGLWLTRWMFGKRRKPPNAHYIMCEFLKF